MVPGLKLEKLYSVGILYHQVDAVSLYADDGSMLLTDHLDLLVLLHPLAVLPDIEPDNLDSIAHRKQIQLAFCDEVDQMTISMILICRACFHLLGFCYRLLCGFLARSTRCL